MSFTATNTGGKYFHTLTISEMPSHNHIQRVRSGDGNLNPSIMDNLAGEHSGTYPITSTGWVHKKTPQTTEYKGDGQPHNNIQPYITVYFWKRIS